MTPETPTDTDRKGSAPGRSSISIETRIVDVGRTLGSTLNAVVEAVPGAPHGPQQLAQTLGVDKVLTSRVLKAARHRDPLAVAHLVPGPEPLRRLLRSARKQNAPDHLVEAAMDAVADFERLIRQEAGDRSALDAIICAWLPAAREQFELRRKQAAYRAMSELKGCRVDVNLATVILNASPDGENIDIVWLMGLLGLHRLRPRTTLKLATRRMAEQEKPRRPATLEGEPIEGMQGVRLDRFCDAPPAPLRVHRVGDVTHYTLAGDGFGPRSAVDLVIAEVNLAEMPRYVPRDRKRKGHVFAEISTPAKVLLFDVLVHEDVYPGSEPALLIYDTVLDGVANVNDRTRDADRLDLLESVNSLGRGIATIRVAEIPNYVELVRHVFDRMGWNDRQFRGYRCRIDYPIYGSQVAMAFDPPPPPGEAG
ncbi:MAG: hypothetical protein ACYS1E_09495 [Planctomycetota bacterium]|jgi:hypothetical protein